MASLESTDLLIICYKDVSDWAHYFKSRLIDFKTEVRCLKDDEILNHIDCLACMLITSPVFDSNFEKNKDEIRRIGSDNSLGIVACCGREPNPNDAHILNLQKNGQKLIFRITEDRQMCTNHVKDIRKILLKIKDLRKIVVTGNPPPLPRKPKKSADDSPKGVTVVGGPTTPPKTSPHVLSLDDVVPISPAGDPQVHTIARKPSPQSRMITIQAPSMLPTTPKNPGRVEKVSIFPKEIKMGDELLFLLEAIVESDKLTVWFENRQTYHKEKTIASRSGRYAFSLRFQDLDVPTGVIHAEVYDGDNYLGLNSFTYLSTTDMLSKLLDSVVNSFQLLTDCLGVDSGNRLSLDHCLATKLKMRTPSKLSSVFKLRKENSFDDGSNMSAKLPTLLHLAAHYGLPNLTELLLKLPGSERALGVENQSGLTPMQLAKKAGYDEVAQIIDDFLSKSSKADDIYLSLIGEEHGCSTVDEIPSQYETVFIRNPLRNNPAESAASPCPEDKKEEDVDSESRTSTLTNDMNDRIDYLTQKVALQPLSRQDSIYMVMSRDPCYQSYECMKGEKNPLCEQLSTATLYTPVDDSEMEVEGNIPLRALPDPPSSADFESSGDSASNVSSPRNSWNASGGKRPSLEEIMKSSAVIRARQINEDRKNRLPEAIQELLEIQQDFKEGHSDQEETLLRFKEWRRRYPETNSKEEKKTLISALRARFGGKRRKSSGVKEMAAAGSRALEMMVQQTVGIARLTQDGLPMTGQRPESTISTASTASGASSRSSGISLGPGTSEDQQDEYISGHRRLTRSDIRCTNDSDYDLCDKY